MIASKRKVIKIDKFIFPKYVMLYDFLNFSPWLSVFFVSGMGG